MAIDLSWIIPVIIILGLILAIWAKVSGQTIMDLFRDIGDFINEKKEDSVERTIGIYSR
jgi:hypothetical protein